MNVKDMEVTCKKVVDVMRFPSTIDFNTHSVRLDRNSAFEIAIALTELHSRRCRQIGECGDMSVANSLARELRNITGAYNDINRITSHFDSIDPDPINIS